MPAQAHAARAALLGLLGLVLPLGEAAAQLRDRDWTLIGGNVQKRANGVLALMGMQLTPDVTTGSLSISNEPTDNPDFRQTSFGGGFTISREFPLYLEGTAGYSRYDPTFVATGGAEQRPIPVKWNSASGTGGIGWDFFLTDELRLRPIFNFSLGRVASDSAIAAWLIENKADLDLDLDFLANGRMKAYGLGGSLMLDYEHYRTDYEIDVELRYTNIGLRSYDSPAAVQGSADSESINLWTRWRAPTGLTMMQRPLRYVLEYTHSTFFGDLDGVLGFNHLNTFGVGLELDSSAYDFFVTRWRMVARYTIGESVSGWSLGLAVSF